MNELNTIELDDYKAVEESQLNRWRVFNGQNWTHGFDDKQNAVRFAKKNGGTRVAFCKKIQGKTRYINVMRVEVDEVRV